MHNFKYRNELKYLINENEIPVIRQMLDPFMSIDPNAKGGKYTISSLYFDDYSDSGFFDVEEGSDIKNKFRIRIYDHDDSFIRLEHKHKKNAMTLKRSCPLTVEEAKQLEKGAYLRNISGQSEVLKELTYKMMNDRYKPVIIVEYERIPYIYRLGNVRITIDMNIESSSDIEHFLDRPSLYRPIMPKGIHLLEVKYDEFLPDFIYDCLNELDLQQISFSKYYLCRKYNVKGGFSL